MHSSKTMPWLPVAALALALAAPLGALAQSQVLEEIVVTATKRETSLMETALSVSALGQEQLDAGGVKNVLDLNNMVPNLQVALSPSDSGVQVAVRGLSSNNFTEIGDPTVAMHFDGLYSPRPQAGLALMYDVERVEINRGPQGTLFGRNSTAGSINVISARPNYDGVKGRVDLELGEFQQLTYKGWLNVPMGDEWAFRGSVLLDQSESWLDQSVDRFDLDWDTNGDGDTDDAFDVPADGIPNVDQRRAREVGPDEAYGAVDRQGLRLGLRWQPTDNIDWNVIYDYFNDQSPGSLALKDCEKAEDTFFACDHDQWELATNVAGYTDMEMKSYRSIFEWQVSEGLLFEYRVAWSVQERSQLNDGTIGYPHPSHPAYGIPRNFFDGASGTTIDHGNLVRDQAVLDALGFEEDTLMPFEDIQQETEYSEYVSLVQEAQLKSQSAGRLQWIAGVFMLQENNEIRFNVEIPFCCAKVLPLAQSFVQPERTIDSFAVFAQFDFALDDRWNLTWGLRYTQDEKEDIGGSNYVTTGFNQPNVGLYDPDFRDPDSTQFDYLSWASVGVTPTDQIAGGRGPYQSNAINHEDGTLGGSFLGRLQRTDNSHSNSWDSITWKVGADYLLRDDIFLYGYLASGFKSGGFGDALDICDCNITSTFDYDPEQNITLELGVKTTLLDGKLNLIGNIFYSDNRDLQQTRYAEITSQGQQIRVMQDYIDSLDDIANEQDRAMAKDRLMPCTGEGAMGTCVEVDRTIGTLLTSNIAEAVNIGIEVEFDWYAWPGGRVHGWVAFLNSEIKEYEGATDNWFCLERALLGMDRCAEEDPMVTDEDGNPLRPSSYNGNALPWSPEISLTINAEHSWYLANGLRLSPYLSLHWQEEIFFDNGNYAEGPFHSGQPAYGTADLSFRVIHEQQAWALELFARNITDEYVRTWGDRGPGFMRASFAKPRHYGLKFNKHF